MNLISMIVMLIVLAVILAFIIAGAARGILRVLFSILSVIVPLILALFLTVPLAEFVYKDTEIGPAVQTKIESFVDKKVEKDISEGIEREQADFIDDLLLPGFVKSSLKKSATLEKYTEIGVNTFKGYISLQLTMFTLKALAFLVILLAAAIALRIIFHVLKVVEKIPILKGFNRFLGAVFGCGEAMLIIWIVCLVIMGLSATEFGIKAMKVINSNVILYTIYDNNALVMLAKSVLGL